MWNTVLVMAIAAGADPVRLGLVAVMLSRRNPAALLLAYAICGYTVNVAVGAVILFLSRHAAGGASIPPGAQIALGVAVLAAGAAIGLRLPERLLRRTPSTERPDGFDTLPGFTRLPRRVQAALRGESIAVAAFIGLCMGFPTPYYLGALAAVLAADARPVTQVAALLVFNAIGFTAALLPLAGFLFAPETTRRRVARAHEWIRVHHRGITGTVAAVTGGFFVLAGLSHL